MIGALIGPPGTGKTTAGIMIASGWIDSGVHPSAVAYLSFTRAAAREAAVRISGREGWEGADDQFPYFRTIHSLAYMGLKRERKDAEVVSTSDLKRFAKETGYEGVYGVHPWEDIAEVLQRTQDAGKTEWDQALAAYSLSRIVASNKQELDRARAEMAPAARQTVGFLENEVYKVFVQKYEAFKRDNGLVDFTDMLEYALLQMQPMSGILKVVVDEAQDLCPLHHAIVDRLFPDADETWWIGDEDQCIYKFSGASPSLFLHRFRTADHRILLRQTHRFGQAIVDFSAKIIRRVRDRVEKEIVGVSGRDGRAVAGAFEPVSGDVLVLHRHVAGCQAAAKAYMDAGVPFRNERGRDPLGASNRVKAFLALYGLASGEHVPVGAAHIMVEDLLPSLATTEDGSTVRLVVHGGKKRSLSLPAGRVNLSGLVDFEVLTPEGVAMIVGKRYRLMRHSDDLEYYDRVIRRGHPLDDRRVPTITTIHGSKGRQAEEVVLFSEMSRKCWDDEDTEHRLAYVAATRTRGGLTICADRTVDWARTQYDYPVEG